MNERIKELAAQCWDRRLDGIHFNQEKFAELIVRKCIEVCCSVAAVKEGYNDAAVADTAYLCGDQIKEHFGAES